MFPAPDILFLQWMPQMVADICKILLLRNCGECCVLYKTDESQICTPETNNIL